MSETSTPSPASLQLAEKRLAWTLAESGDHLAAVPEVAELVRIGQNPAALYNAAYVLGVCVRSALGDPTLSDAKRQELVQAYAQQAIDLLRQAMAKGFRGL